MTDKQIDDEVHGYTVVLPDLTPHGQTVVIQRGDRVGAHVLHAESPDQSELYVEVTTYPQRTAHDALISSQQEFLRSNALDPVLSATGDTTLAGRQATTFDFEGLLQGRLKRRRFVFVDVAARTYRVVYDHTSPLNAVVLQSLVFSAPA